MLCVAISSLLWTLLKFSEEKEEELNVKVEFFNFPKDQILVNELVQSFPVKIKAQGFELISQGLGFSKPTVKIDLSKVRVLKKGDVNQYVWLPKHNGQDVIRAFNLEINSIEYPVDTVKVRFSPRVVKELVTKFNYSIEKLTDHYIVGKALESPSSVKVSGAKSILKNIDTIYSELVKFDRLESDLNADYSLLKVKGMDSIFTDSIEVYMGVESIEPFSFEVPIEVRNVPDSLRLKLFPNEVEIHFSCGTKEYVNYNPQSFQPYIDYNDINPSFNKMSIKLDNPPKGIRDIRVEPFNVEYLLRSKD